MDRFVARQNIERFRGLLAKETDPARRAEIDRLLQEAHDQLRRAEDDHWQNPPKPTGS